MVEIKRPLKKPFEHVDTHVIFIHGLAGDLEKTWISSTGSDAEFWPHWLDEELPNVAVWSVGYPAARVKWTGAAMAVEDRAKNILARLLTETALSTGTIVLVGHSMGGIIIKEMLRLAQQQSGTGTRPDVAAFEERVRKTAFIATPHQGSWMSSMATGFGIASAATKSLTRNNPHLRDLSQWYIDYVVQNRVGVLGLGETLRTFWGTVVPLDSSDIHLPSPAEFIALDADHSSITAPPDRSADVYVLLKKFVLDAPVGQHERTTLSAKQDVAQQSLDELLRRTGGGMQVRGPVNPIIDRTALERIWQLRKSRYFLGVDPAGEARRLGRDILEGELLEASAATRASALAWCARILSSFNADEADRLAVEARRLTSTDETTFAAAFVTAARGDRPAATAAVGTITTPMGRSATLMLGIGGLSIPDAVAWIDGTAPQFDDLDSDGKFKVMQVLLGDGQISRVAELAERVTAEDTACTPALFHPVAMSNLLSAVPAEKQDMLIDHVPLDWRQFPLREDTASMEHRRKARAAFEAGARAAGELGCELARQNAEDYALWLGLRDPEGTMGARESLIRSMSNPRDMVHRVPMAIQFGLQLDRAAVDQAITAVEAGSGEAPNDALMARFVLARQDSDPGAFADFIGANRDRLSQLVDGTSVAAFEIQALAYADRQPEAQEKLDALRAGGTATEGDIQQLEEALSDARGEDTVSAQEERFRATGSIDDLLLLVGRLQGAQEWRRLVPYARDLFGRLNDLKSATVYARALHHSGDWPAAISFIEGQAEFLQRSDILRGVLAWSLYKQGELIRARQTLQPLLTTRDDPSDRDLQVTAAITSGDWESLAPFVETAWERRADRTATELLQAGQIGAIIGSARTKDLVKEAVAKEPDEPGILVTAYHVAVSGGWEDDEAVAAWLQTAMASAGEATGGPIQRMSIDDLMDMRPDWERQEAETWDQLTRGDMPLFAAAMRLNRTTTSMILTPALANLDERDPRKRGMFLNYSGRISAPASVEATAALDAEQTTIALEASSLLVLSFLGRLETVIDRFRKTMVPHSTLRWLLDERQKVQFHQPTQVQASQNMRNLLALPSYFVVDPSVSPTADLVDEVGEELAVLLTTARADDGDTSQKIVVRPGPVHRPMSLMKENADLSQFGDVLCGCSDIVEALLAQGHITDAVAAKAMAYLRLHEVRWPQVPQINPGATLLLDDLAISNLQHLDLLGTLGIAGFRVGIPQAHVDRMNALIRYEAYATVTSEHIEGIRAALTHGLVSGKVAIGPETADQETELARIGQHPTAGVFALAPLVDLLVVDDRALNKYPQVDAEGRNVLIGCTLDLLAMLEKADAITPADRTEDETRLRRGGFQMMPLRLDELLRLVNAAAIRDGEIQETAHLRAIRESIERLRMTDALQLPLDQAWFDQLLLIVREAVRAQWNDETDDATARARSDWLLGLLPLQGWAHRFDRSNDRDAIISRSRMMSWLVLSIPLTGIGDSLKRYSAWMNDTLVAAMKSTDPESFTWLVGEVRRYVEEFAQELDERRNDDA